MNLNATILIQESSNAHVAINDTYISWKNIYKVLVYTINNSSIVPLRGLNATFELTNQQLIQPELIVHFAIEIIHQGHLGN